MSTLNPHGVSEDMPAYFQVKQVPLTKVNPQLTKSKAKKIQPDRSNGISAEFPACFRLQHQLISSYSRHNPYL